MKVVLTCHQFLPEYSAGTEVLTLETARALRALGHEVLVFTSCPRKEDGGRCVDYMYDGFAVHLYIPKSLGRKGPYNAAREEYDDPILGGLFDTYLAKNRPDVVHFFHLMRLTTSTVKAAQRRGIATVFTPTDFWTICPTSQLRLPNQKICAGPEPDAINCIAHIIHSMPPVRKQLRFIFKLPIPLPLLRLGLGLLDGPFLRNWRLAANIRSIRQRLGNIRDTLSGLDRFLIPSRVMFELYSKHGYPGEKMTLSHYGLVDAHRYPAKARRPMNEVLVIGFIGSLHIHKGAHILVKAVTSLPPECRCTLKIYGSELDDIRYSQRLRKLAGKDPRVLFCGSFPKDTIGAIMAGIDVLCVPSIWLENIPLVLLSAHAAKVPVIASNVGGLSEVVQHGINGFLFPVGKHKPLAAIICNLIRESALLEKVTAGVTPPKDINDYARECVAQYEMALTRAGMA